MGLLEIKFTLERQVRSMKAQHSELEYSRNTMKYYEDGEPVPDEQFEQALLFLKQSITAMETQIKNLEASKAYRKEYETRYAVPASEASQS